MSKIVVWFAIPDRNKRWPWPYQNTDVEIIKTLRLNGMCLSYVDDQTTEMCVAAVSNTHYSLQFVADNSDESYINLYESPRDGCIYKNLFDPSKKHSRHKLAAYIVKCKSKKRLDIIAAVCKALEDDKKSFKVSVKKFLLRYLKFHMSEMDYQSQLFKVLTLDESNYLNMFVKDLSKSDRAYFIDRIAGKKKYSKLFD